MQKTVRVAIVDDHDLFLRGLELLLPEATGGRVTVVASTGDAAYAASVVRHAVPDLVLVDLHMPYAGKGSAAPGGIRAITAIRAASPRARVLAMSGDDDPALAVAALHAGAVGFLPKSSEPASLLPPLLAALEGWAVLPAALLPVLAGPPVTSPAAESLSDDDRALLRLIANGASTVQIAAELHVSERTVKRLTAGLLRRLRVSSRTEAAALAGSAGLV
ncbi:DNA-binding response regulator [Paractinoplanes abujensis]|uniref:DNA-binding NarL/FixJ family response regulator n=1 Tax=Paractinoplanes abujensis TaxID=882441 RepID=A0A7W7CVH6_9ACTN|nr:response regulator transcription factor [Actinoplanes abujensis]MBB4693741.1 DNA-binding NarL/FixJ family response regulator [Actinoplanes abujensis]GID21602.1 DNA-binding response regulator [Actinoplanes abujensis]